MVISVDYSKQNNIVCRIITDKESGSGVIFDIDADKIYILTCFHVIKDFKNMSISFYVDHEVINVDVDFDIGVLQNEKDDTAILIIPRICNANFKFIPKLFAVKQTDFKNEMILSGYPIVKNRGSTLKNVVLDKGRTQNDVFRTEVKTETQVSFGWENCRGFSGGAIFVKVDDYLYLVGIVKEYSEEFNYFTYTFLEKYNSLLISKSFPPIILSDFDISLIPQLYLDSRSKIDKIRYLIGNNIFLERQDTVNKILDSEKQVCIVGGMPGVGKTVILRNIINELSTPWFFFKAEDLDQNCKTKIKAIVELSKLCNHRIIVMIDGIEKIFELEYENNFVEIFKELYRSETIQTILSIREYSIKSLEKIIRFDCDYRYEYLLVNVSDIDDSEFSLVEKTYPELSKLNSTTKELLKNPFYLDVIIKEKQIGNLENITNEYQIKDLIWEVITESASEIKSALLQLARLKLD